MKRSTILVLLLVLVPLAQAADISQLVSRDVPSIDPQTGKPKIVFLANSVDYALASDAIASLEARRMLVIRVNASDFDRYMGERFIVVLGGPDAYEGVGGVVSEVLRTEEISTIRVPGAKVMYVRRNVWLEAAWLTRQTVFIVAGSDRYGTQKALSEHLESIFLRAF
ncbi:MAG: hypothetical protein AABX40_04025 [Candidatus Hydrothermarchaeota archaeon]